MEENRMIEAKKYNVVYEMLLVKSGGVCDICSVKFKNKEPYVDHCHSTGRVRGLLCNDCNVGLGRFKDNDTLLINAIKYLRNDKEIPQEARSN
jgi:hypothetical protein